MVWKSEWSSRVQSCVTPSLRLWILSEGDTAVVHPGWWHRALRGADTPEGRGAVQRDTDWLEKGADRNLKQFSTERTKSCSWEQPQAPALVGNALLGSSLGRKGPGAPAGHQKRMLMAHWAALEGVFSS